MSLLPPSLSLYGKRHMQAFGDKARTEQSIIEMEIGLNKGSQMETRPLKAELTMQVNNGIVILPGT